MLFLQDRLNLPKQVEKYKVDDSVDHTNHYIEHAESDKELSIRSSRQWHLVIVSVASVMLTIIVFEGRNYGGRIHTNLIQRAGKRKNFIDFLMP